MKKTATTIKELIPKGPAVGLKQVSIRCTAKEYEHLKSKADKYARGNVNAYLKHLMLKFEPRAEDLG